jgi:hypothetical protein
LYPVFVWQLFTIAKF